MRILTTIVFCLLAIPAIVYAQHDNIIGLDTFEFRTVRLPMKAFEAGSDITIITAEQIRQLPANTTDELLRFVSGLEGQGRGPFGVQTDLSLRGSTFSQVLVLVDGMRLNDPLTGHFNHAIPVSPAEIARIEVLKGPAAAHYGADAVGGIIHIITKAYVAEEQAEGFSGSAAVQGGQHNLKSGTGGAFRKKGPWTLSAGGQAHVSDGHPLPDDDRAWFRVYTASASAGYRLNDRQRLLLRTGFDSRSFNARYFYTRSPFDRSEEQTRTVWNHLKWTHRGEKGHTEADLAHRWNSDWFLFNPAFPPANEHTTQFWNGQVFHTHRFSEAIHGLAGVQASHRSIRSNDRGDHDVTHGALFAGARYRPVVGLTLLGNLRLDYDGNYGPEVCPQLSVVYVAGKAVLRANAGRSIRAADFTERFISNNLPGPLPSGRNLGNPDLLAERAWSAEAGTDLYLARGLKVSVTAFYRYSPNVIDYVLTPAAAIPNNQNLDSSGTYLYTTNINRATTYGVEAALYGDWTFGQFRLRGHSGFQVLDVQTEEEVVSKYLTAQARQLFTTAWSLQHQRAVLSITGLYKVRPFDEAPAIDAVLDESYTVWNIALDVNAWKQTAWLRLQVHNVFDAAYADIIGVPMPGRWVMVGLVVRTP